MVASVAVVLLAVVSVTPDAVLLQFSSQNCPPCRDMQPTVERLTVAGHSVRRVDVDNYPQVARQYDVREIPCFVMLHGGRETDRVVGKASFDRLQGMFAQPDTGAARGQATFVSSPMQQPAQQQQAQYQPAPYRPEPYQSAAAAPPAASVAPASYQQMSPAPRAVQVVPTDYRQATSNDVDPADIRRRAVAASVRLKVEDDAGFGFGTGTIIDTHDEEALVVTCGHLFRDSQGKGKITVDLFAPGATAPVMGTLIAYDLTRDIALVSIRPGMAITPMIVASGLQPIVPRDRVFSVGCDKGGEPSVRDSQVNGINKFQGPPNVTVAGQPVDGRSGGGLFSERGELIGICNAANPTDDEGLYAALGSIHWQLDQISQTQLYKREETQVAQQMVPQQFEAAGPALVTSEAPVAMQTSGNFELPNEQLPGEFAQRQPAGFNVQPASAMAPAMAPPAASVAPAMPMARPAAAEMQSSVAPMSGEGMGADEEMILIVRSKSNPSQPSQVFVIERPSPRLLSEMAAVARPLTGDAGNSQVARGEMSREDVARREYQQQQPIVRGQSQP